MDICPYMVIIDISLPCIALFGDEGASIPPFT